MSRPERMEERSPVFEALVNYSVDTGMKPASYGGINTFEADKKRTGKYQEHRVPIYDGRTIANDLSLEREGFIFVHHDTQMQDFYDEAEVRSVYYPEIEQLVKKTSGAKRVLVFDHTLRSADTAMREAKQISGPVRNAHNDYTEWSGPQRVRDLLPDEAEELLKRRFAVVQVWRPIRHPVDESPWRLPMREVSEQESCFLARAFTRTGLARSITALTIRNTAGITSPKCGETRRSFSRRLIRQRMAAPVGPRIRHLTTPPVLPTLHRVKASK